MANRNARAIRAMLAQEVDEAEVIHFWAPIRRTHEVAKLFGLTPAAIRLAAARGDLVPTARASDGEALYDAVATFEYADARVALEGVHSALRTRPRPRQRALPFSLGKVVSRAV